MSSIQSFGTGSRSQAQPLFGESLATKLKRKLKHGVDSHPAEPQKSGDELSIGQASEEGVLPGLEAKAAQELDARRKIERQREEQDFQQRLQKYQKLLDSDITGNGTTGWDILTSMSEIEDRIRTRSKAPDANYLEKAAHPQVSHSKFSQLFPGSQNQVSDFLFKLADRNQHMNLDGAVRQWSNDAWSLNRFGNWLVQHKP